MADAAQPQALDSNLGPGKGFADFLKATGLPTGEDVEKKETAALEQHKKDRQPFIDQSDALMKQMTELNTQVDKIKPPKAPTLTPLPDAPDTQYKDPMQAMGGLGSVIAAIGSLKTRAPFTSALNSAAASMKAYHQGDMERAELERQKWHDNLAKGLKQNQLEMQQYTAALEESGFDIQKAQAKFRVIAAQNEHNAMNAAIESGDFNTQMHIIDMGFKAGTEATKLYVTDQEKRAQIEANRLTREAMYGGGSSVNQLDEGGKKVYEELLRSNSPIPKTRRGAVDYEMLNYMGAHEKGGAGSGDVAGSKADYKANLASYTALNKDLNMIEPYKRMLDINGDVAIELQKKIIKTNSALANKPINWLKQNMGDNPDTAEYLFQINALQTEAARVINNPRLVGQLTDAARQDMQHVIDGNMPFDATERVIKRMQKDGTYRVEQMQKQVDTLRDKMFGRTSSNATPAGGAGWTADDEARLKELEEKHGAQ